MSGERGEHGTLLVLYDLVLRYFANGVMKRYRDLTMSMSKPATYDEYCRNGPNGITDHRVARTRMRHL
jgi:hypothetical protein